MKTRISKEAFNQKRRVLCDHLNRALRKRLVKCFVWGGVCGAKTWTLRENNEGRLGALEMWMWIRI